MEASRILLYSQDINLPKECWLKVFIRESKQLLLHKVHAISRFEEP